ncbi:MAG: S41 family peptidase [Thermoanaerobaculia bacterium]
MLKRLAPALLLLIATSARADITAEQARGVVDEVSRLVASHYVFPEKRAAIGEALRSAKAAGRYNTTNAMELADRLSQDLAGSGQDRHLYVRYNPEEFERLRKEKPDQDTSPWSADESRRRNYGFEELRILGGNVRYAKITNFMWFNDVTGPAIDDVTRFLRDGDAIILDLRGNGGGDARAVQYLVSHFLNKDELLMTFDDRMEGTMTQSRVLANLPSGRILGKPLYVLIDDGVGSAAEEFAYHVAQFKLGTLIGRTTAGAANNNTLFAVPPAFVASISTGRAIHAVSKTNWEGVGVKPDVETAPAAALDVAHLMALQKMPASPLVAWIIDGLQARAHPVTVPAADLSAYAGRYGIRSIRVENGALVFQRDGRDPIPLVPMAPDLFAFTNTDEIRLRFRRGADGNVVGFEQVTRDGQVVPSERSSS